ncbi:hypothetical protein HPB51_009027 [Rhipicephalus microplus]|uniref:Uncharacterized protein n=1 Tax=Rhipicephalus microplus TaxID=6941 RepID=A0A9J6D8Z2_RHIMP|nr:hypothetical protein HPB51_009027 [Rhipicephalus microplus]
MTQVVVVRKTTFLGPPPPSDLSGCRQPFSSGPDVRSRSHIGPKRKPLFWPIQRVAGHLKELFPSGPLCRGLEHGKGGRRSDMGTELLLRNSSFAQGPWRGPSLPGLGSRASAGRFSLRVPLFQSFSSCLAPQLFLRRRGIPARSRRCPFNQFASPFRPAPNGSIICSLALFVALRYIFASHLDERERQRDRGKKLNKIQCEHEGA